MKLLNYKWIQNIKEKDISGKNILIAGGTGFIGKRLLQVLSQFNAKVYVITRRENYINTDKIIYLNGDLCDLDNMKSLRTNIIYDVAIYMAAYIPLRGENRESLLDAKKSTFDPYINFLEVFGKHIKQLIYISSIDALGKCTRKEYDENVFPDCPTPYGLAKYVGEFYTKSIADELDIPFTILRFSQVYGPNEPVVRIIPILKRSLIERQKFTLVTSGNERRKFLYIDDAVQAICRVIIKTENGIFNIAGQNEVTILELIEYMEKIWNRKLDLEIKHSKIGADNIPSIARANELLEYYPEVSIEVGLSNIKEVENEIFSKI